MHDEVATCMLALVAKRGPEKTVCPTEVARALDAVDWRDQMDEVRAVAVELAAQGKIAVTQRGEVVDLLTAKGPIRLGLPRQ